MKRILTLILMLISMASIVSFSSPENIRTSMATAEKVIFSRPDSALAIIEQIDTSQLFWRKDKAKYSLLHTMAIDRNGIDTTDLSIIRDAINYYNGHGSVQDKARTAFYHGRILFNGKDYNGAIKSFLKALKYSDQLNDNWLKGMICALIAIVHNKNHNDSDELKYNLLSYNSFCAYGDSLYINNGRILLALAYHNNRLFDKADSVYSSISEKSHCYANALLGIASNEVTRSNRNVSRAVQYFKLAEEHRAQFTLDQLYQYAYALFLDGQKEECKKLWERIDQYSADVKSLHWKYLIEKESGNEQQAFIYVEEYLKSLNAYVHTQLSQSLYKSESDYFSSIAEAEQLRNKQARQVMLIAVLSALLLSLLFIILYQKRLIRLRNELDAISIQLEETHDLLVLLQARERENAETEDRLLNLRASFVSMYKQRFASIGKLFNVDMKRSALPERVQQEFALQISELFSEISAGKENQERFETRINKDLDNIISKLRADFPRLDEKTIRFLCYVIIGFKDPTISVITNESLNTVSTRKSRLKKQILAADSPNHDLYELLIK